MSPAVDPGWGPSLRAVPRILLPFLGAHRALRDANGLVVLRTLWLAFLGSVVLIGAVVLFLGTVELGHGPDGRVVGAVVVGLGVVAQLAAGVLLPAITGATPAAAVAAVQRHVLLRVALAEVAALVGFMGFVISVNPAVYLAGAVVAVAGLVDAMPSGDRLGAWQRELDDHGSSVDLLAALVSTGMTR